MLIDIGKGKAIKVSLVIGEPVVVIRGFEKIGGRLKGAKRSVTVPYGSLNQLTECLATISNNLNEGSEKHKCQQ